MRFKCAAGHQWTTQGRIIRTGSWCPVCVGRVRVTLAQLQRRARALDGGMSSEESRTTIRGQQLPARCAHAKVATKDTGTTGRILRSGRSGSTTGRPEQWILIDLTELAAAAATRGRSCARRLRLEKAKGWKFPNTARTREGAAKVAAIASQVEPTSVSRSTPRRRGD